MSPSSQAFREFGYTPGENRNDRLANAPTTDHALPGLPSEAEARAARGRALGGLALRPG
jgi:hypothetical protein